MFRTRTSVFGFLVMIAALVAFVGFSSTAFAQDDDWSAGSGSEAQPESGDGAQPDSGDGAQPDSGDGAQPGSGSGDSGDGDSSSGGGDDWSAGGADSGDGAGSDDGAASGDTGGDGASSSAVPAPAPSSDFARDAQGFEIFRAGQPEPGGFKVSAWFSFLNINDFEFWSNQFLINFEHTLADTPQLSLYAHWGFQWLTSITGNSGIAPLHLGVKYNVVAEDGLFFTVNSSFGLPTQSSSVNSFYMPSQFANVSGFGADFQWRVGASVLYALSDAGGLGSDLHIIFDFGGGDDVDVVWRIEYVHMLDSLNLRGGFSLNDDDPVFRLHLEVEMHDPGIFLQIVIFTEDAPEMLFNLGYSVNF